MELRPNTIFTGTIFQVPTHIVRLDEKNTHGWQLRYGRWKLYSDHSNDGTGAPASLKAASEELAKRIAKLPAPTGIRTEPAARKSNEMPVGVSGPREVRRKKTKVKQYYLQVTYPVSGGSPANRQIYIATENTYSEEKLAAALEKAIAMREAHVRKFKLANTKRKRELAASAGVTIANDA